MTQQSEFEDFIGIDVGCSTCCIAVMMNGRAEVIPDQEQLSRTIPSCVSFSKKGELLIGEAALDRQESNVGNTVVYPLKLLGISPNDPFLEQLPYKVNVNEGKGPVIKFEYENQVHELCIEQVLAILFYYLKENAEKFIGTKVTKAFINIPTHFNHSQRQSIINVSKIAGFTEVRIMTEGTASIYTWIRKQETKGEKNVLTFSLGAGYCGVSVFNCEDGVVEEISSNGIDLGGIDFDQKLFEYCCEEFYKKHKYIKLNAQGIVKLKKACEKAKKNLSAASVTVLHVDSLMENIDFELSISRSKFEELNKDLFQQVVELVDQTIQESELERSKIEEIILTGGSSRIPYIQTKLSELFNGKSLCKTINADEAVALGCSLRRCLFPIEKCSRSITACFENTLTRLVVRNESDLYGTSKKVDCLVSNHKQALIDLYEGESSFMKNNTLLGYYKIDNPPMNSKLEIEFGFSSSGFSVKCINHEKVVITPHFKGLKDNEIEVFKKHLQLLFERNIQLKQVQESRIEMEEKIYSIKSLCDYYLEWLEDNPNATIQEICSKKEELNKSLKNV